MIADPAQIPAVLSFWFEELDEQQWWLLDPDVDAAVRDRFGALYDALAQEVPPVWRASAESYLAAVIVLDQFPRNMFRNDARAYATDAKALALSREAIEKGLDAQLAPPQRSFLYMPFQHSEDADVQAQSMILFGRLGDEKTLDFARRHCELIDRFGRFPHRNADLGRESTPEELAFLREHGRGY